MNDLIRNMSPEFAIFGSVCVICLTVIACAIIVRIRIGDDTNAKT